MTSDLSDFSKYVSEVSIQPVQAGKWGAALGKNEPPLVLMSIHINWQQVAEDAKKDFDPGLHPGHVVPIATSIAERTVKKIAADLTAATGVQFNDVDTKSGKISAKLSTVEFTDVMAAITPAIATQQRREEASYQISR